MTTAKRSPAVDILRAIAVLLVLGRRINQCQLSHGIPKTERSRRVTGPEAGGLEEDEIKKHYENDLDGAEAVEPGM